jgi:hypothetical protein
MPVTKEEHARLNEEIKARKAEQQLYAWDEELLEVFTKLLEQWANPDEAISLCRPGEDDDWLRFYSSASVQSSTRYRADKFGDRALDLWNRFREQTEKHITQYLIETLEEYVAEVTVLRDADLYVAAGESVPTHLSDRAPRRIKLREEETEAAEAAS